MRDNIFHCKRCNEFCHINEQTEYYLCINCVDELETFNNGIVNIISMNKTNCNYYTHDFKKKGGWLQTWSGEPNNVRYIQEMECTKCKITTYYPTEAFSSNGELK